MKFEPFSTKHTVTLTNGKTIEAIGKEAIKLKQL